MTALPGAEKVVLLADNDSTFSRTLSQALERHGYVVHRARSAEEAVPWIPTLQPNFGVFDLKLPGASGLVLVELLHRIRQEARVVLLVGLGSVSMPSQLGNVILLPKSASADEIEEALSQSEPLYGGRIPTLINSKNEVEFLQVKLHEHHGNLSETARALKMHRRTLQRKLARDRTKQN